MNCSPSPARGAPGHATELLEAQIPGLRRYAYALLHGDREGADDLVQDSLERALSCWHQRRRDGDLRGWIYTILYHRFLTDRRRQRSNVGRRSLAEILEPEQPGVEGGQEGALAYRDLLRGFAELPEEQRSVLLLIAVGFLVSGNGARSRPADRHGDVAAVTRSGAPTPIHERRAGWARPALTNNDTGCDGQSGAIRGRNCSAVRRMATTEGVSTIAG